MDRRLLPSLERLRTLREVARLGGFSAAGEALGLTQPAVSNQIRHLEQQLGTALLERIGKRARLTPEGEILLAAHARAAGELDAALEEIARLSAELSGTLVLAAGATATRHLLPAAMAELGARHPGIALRILTGNTQDMLPGLVEGTIDIGLLTAPIRERHLASKFFFRDRLVCIAPTAEAPRRRALRAADLAGRHLVLYDRGGSIRLAIDGWLEARRRGVRVTDIGSAEAQSAFVQAGLGWSIISEMAARADAAAGRVTMLALQPALFRDLVLVWRTDRANRPAIAAALAVLSRHAARRG